MSAKWTFWAWDQPIKSAPKKLALLQLANNANDDGKSWYSIVKMAVACGVSERTFQRSIKDLESDHLLCVERRSNRPSIYQLKDDEFEITLTNNGGDRESGIPNKGGDTVTGQGDTVTGQGDGESHDLNSTPNNYPNSSNKPKPFSEEIEKGYFIDQLDFDDFTHCKSAMRSILKYKEQLGSEDNIYAGSLSIEAWSECENKLRSVANTHEEIEQLIYNIHQQKCTNQKSVSLPFILHTNIMTDDEFAHVAINCESWIV